MQFLMALLEHPIVLVVLLMFFMGFVGMTYEFILRMCGKKPFVEPSARGSYRGDEPPEQASVPKPPTDPDGELQAAEEIPDGAEEVEDEDGNVTVQYTYPKSIAGYYEDVPQEYMYSIGDPDDNRPWWAKDWDNETRYTRDIIKERNSKKEGETNGIQHSSIR